MGETTDYFIVTIVAIVGLVAVIAMMPSSPSLESVESSQVGAAVSLPPYSQLDYNSDGYINTQDSQLLADAIAFDACPDFKVCDLDANRVYDERDLALLNNLLAEPAEAEKQESNAVTGYVTAKPVKKNSVVGYSSVTTTLA